MMVFIVNVCILRQRSKKNANEDIKCEQGFTRTVNVTSFSGAAPLMIFLADTLTGRMDVQPI